MNSPINNKKNPKIGLGFLTEISNLSIGGNTDKF